MYKFEYKLTKDDYIDFNIHHTKTSASMKKAFACLRFITPILFILIPFVIKRGTDKIMIATFIIAAILWIFIFPKYYWKSIKKNISKIVDEGDNGDLFGNRILTISDLGIEEILDNGNNTKKWSAITKIDESIKSIFIYFSSVEAAIIPKTLFNNNDEINKFIEYCKQQSL